jgi:hypothetical protein
MLEPIPFAGMVEIDESFDRTASHMVGEYVSYRELTDEEIQKLALSNEFWISEDCTIFDWHKFARAILRKAQEK